MDENLPEKIKKTYGYEEVSIIADVPIPNNSNRIILANAKDSEGLMRKCLVGIDKDGKFLSLYCEKKD